MITPKALAVKDIEVMVRARKMSFVRGAGLHQQKKAICFLFQKKMSKSFIA
jgi:hypothetical protein